MRTSILAVLALVAIAAVSVAAQSSTGGAGPVPTSICERITSGLKMDAFDPASQFAAVTVLLVRAATGTNTTTPANGLFVNPITKGYFDGTIKYRNGTVTASPFASQLPGAVTPDFTNAAFQSQLGQLLNHLASFFGPSLGCKVATGSAYPPYATTYGPFGAFTQYQVHANMQIGAGVFAAFNNQVLSAAASLGATQADADAVSGVLATFGRNNVAGSSNANVICTQADCPCAATITGDNCDNVNSVASTSASFVTLAAAALVALFAMRR